MLAQLSAIFTEIIAWVGEFVSALTATDGALAGLLPLLVIGIGISLVMVCVKIVRKITWGA